MYYSLSKREIDILITVQRPQAGKFIARKLTGYKLGLFASKQYLADHQKIGEKEELRGHRFVGYIDDLLFDRDLRFMEEFYPGVTPILRTSTVIAQMNAVVAGAGIGVIPYFMAHAEKELVPVLPDQSIERGYWLQFNPDSRQIARVRTTIDFIVKQIESDKDLFLALPNDKEITGLKFYSCCNDVVIKQSLESKSLVVPVKASVLLDSLSDASTADNWYVYCVEGVKRVSV